MRKYIETVFLLVNTKGTK